MPDKRIHRGPAPDDGRLFGKDQIPLLRRAVEHYSWLLTRDYAQPSALKLVGDHLGLDRRQRMAVMRSACSDQQLALRKQNQIPPAHAAGQTLLVDGYNILITLEAALGGAFLFVGRDGCIRDLAGLHGTWRKVTETLPAIELSAAAIDRIGPRQVRWLLDRPVSNSGRLKAILQECIEKNSRPWTVELHQNPDKILCQSPDPVATSDSAILDQGPQWINLTKLALEITSPAEHTSSIIDLQTEIYNSRILPLRPKSS
jgi:hypothetical protein